MEVVLFRHSDDNVHHIRNAAGAFAALLQLPVNHRRHDDLPGILTQKPNDDLLDLPVGDHIALADKHGQRNGVGCEVLLA
ncbi:MAG: hypothetical protein BGO83_09190 [Devosia sp. 66-14]|nr:MAG: hypothetical protein ABS47_21660 [Devosia sp. SCN 66-27]OJX25793.1 MAG: hypothetical protein BGO83_09190 [Devosia sp. 66-14]